MRNFCCFATQNRFKDTGYSASHTNALANAAHPVQVRAPTSHFYCLPAWSAENSREYLKCSGEMNDDICKGMSNRFRFSNRDSIILHQKQHRNERTHFCMVCDKGFFKSSCLTRHMRCEHYYTWTPCSMNSSYAIMLFESFCSVSPRLQTFFFQDPHWGAPLRVQLLQQGIQSVHHA